MSELKPKLYPLGMTVSGFSSDGDDSYYKIYINPQYKEYSKLAFTNGLLVDPRVIIRKIVNPNSGN